MAPANVPAAHGLSRVAVEGEAILRAAAPGRTQHDIALAAGRPTKNIGREIAQVIAAGLMHDTLALTEAGEAAIAALDRAAGAAAPHAVRPAILHTDIDPDPNQPRRAFSDDDLEELAASIVDRGLLQRILLRPHPEAAARLMVVSGERRWRAIGKAVADGRLPADFDGYEVREMTEAEARVNAILENIQRVDLSALEKLDAYQDLIARHPQWPEREQSKMLAELLKKSLRHVQDILRLGLMTKTERQQMADGDLTLEAARAVLKGRKEPIDLPLNLQLILAEVFDRANGFDPSPAYYRQADRSPLVTAEAFAEGLTAEQAAMLTFTGPAIDGQMKVALTPEGEQALKQLAPDILKADRVSALLGLRARVVGADEAERLDSAGESAVSWLNGPFDPTPEGQARVDEEKQRLAAMADEDTARTNARKEADRLSQGRAARARHLAITLADAEPDAVAAHIAEAGHRLPWRDSGAGYLVDADGQIVRTEDDELLPLIMAAMNRVIGAAADFGDDDEEEAAAAVSQGQDAEPEVEPA